MSTSVGSIHYELGLDTNKFDRAASGLSGKLSKVGGRMSDVGKKMTTGITLPVVAGFGLAVKAASDLNETLNKVDVAFKDQSESVKKWASDSISKMGLAKQSALDAAALFGDMATGMGLNTKEAAKMSKGLTQLGADLASFKNISFERAQIALAGVFTGETEALKGLGIVMTEANLKSFALASGFKKTSKDSLAARDAAIKHQKALATYNDAVAKNGKNSLEAKSAQVAMEKAQRNLNGVMKGGNLELTQAEKVQLRYKYVLNQTKNAQGDFARTSGGTANQIRMTQERFKELSAEIGARLLPLANRLLGWANGMLSKFSSMSPSTQNLILKLAGLAAVIGPLLIVTGKLFTAVSAISTAVKGLGAASLMTAGAFGVMSGALALAAPKLMLFSSMQGQLKGKLNEVSSALQKQGYDTSFLSDKTTALQFREEILKQTTDRVSTAQRSARMATLGLKDARLSLKGASLSVERAQRTYTEAVKQYGPKSLEAREAAFQLKNAQNEQKKASNNAKDAVKRLRDEQKKLADAKGHLSTIQEATDKANSSQSAFSRAATAVGNFFRKLAGGGGGSATPKIGGTGDLLKVGNNAQGTNDWRGGLSWVGEKGPELLNLPRGSQVIPNHKATAGGLAIYGNVNIGDKPTADYFFTRAGRSQELSSNGMTPLGGR